MVHWFVGSLDLVELFCFATVCVIVGLLELLESLELNAFEFLLELELELELELVLVLELVCCCYR